MKTVDELQRKFFDVNYDESDREYVFFESFNNKSKLLRYENEDYVLYLTSNSDDDVFERSLWIPDIVIEEIMDPHEDMLSDYEVEKFTTREDFEKENVYRLVVRV
jgi:hypothetical protein